LQQLTLAWMLYAEENKGGIVSSDTSPITASSGSPRTFNWAGTPTWVGWWCDGPGWPGYDPVRYADKEAREATIKIGLLYPYAKSMKTYKCPTGNPGEVLTYTPADSMNETNGFFWVSQFPSYYKVFTRISAIPRPSDRMVFIDEGMATAGGFLVYAHVLAWWDPVPTRHAIGTTLSFADGHSEYWKWQSRDTATYTRDKFGQMAYLFKGPADIRRMQKAMWGRPSN
jgi:hypothetical protein